MGVVDQDRKVIILEPGDLIELLFVPGPGERSRLLVKRDDVVLIDLNAPEITGRSRAAAEMTMSKTQFQQVCSSLTALQGLTVDEVQSHRGGRNCVVTRP